MWKFVLGLTLPFVPLAAAQAEMPESDVQCLIRAEPVSGGVELEGVVVSKTPLSGTYSFDVRKSGSAGTSTSSQSGTFEVSSDEEVVGHVGLGLEPGASYDAELVVRWNGSEVTCKATGPDRA